ncbi:cytochrome P450 family monooxygenase (macronuclear) [Tetrahymena thermophila SB210]|uniref:Cytochrome P450 family monooxygenase n=2 Tax=Tetrahymena thermophila TaxID=5911 RepID=Q232X8_TETTS|nr:cytochrome P450 family monooxygenase [Tetrahymena thermophila SB210]ABY59990.1 cytochrome P450 monooxygenase CYP5013D1 [Tetrahymena thermophila]EAR91702.1 cytochrome P450 family monooxygenase [Tetrahymena thermophila SB210]|eukprot:XP_001011947.1 cytochrome P450 family monooxygenase [Tetrahymena thermophila SB210]
MVSYFALAGLAIVLYILYVFIINPYLQYRKYLKWGKGSFYPFVGVFYGAGLRVKQYKDVDHHLKHMYDDGSDPKIYVENNATGAIIKISDPEYIKEFVQLENKAYQKTTLLIDNIIRLVGQGIIFSEGPQWKKNRNVLSGVFHFEQLSKRVPSIEKITKEVYKRYIDSGNVKNVDVIELFQEITAEVVIQTFFSNISKDKSFYGMSLSVALSYLINSVGKQISTPFYFLFRTNFFKWGIRESDRKLNKQIKEFRQMIGDIINERIKEEEELEKRGEQTTKEDLVYYLKKNNLLGVLSLDEIISEFMTFYVAGMDTTGHLCGMAIWFLTQHPEIKKKLQEELDANTDYSQNGLLKLPYLNGVIQETQRLYGPAGQLFNRVALRDHMLKDIPIKKGTIVKPSPCSVHRHPKYFEDPHSFKPERWFNKNTVTPYTFIPFNAGPRNCIGQHLALIEARIMINYFMKTFDFESDPNFEMVLNYAFLIEPVDKLRINLKLKENPLIYQ